MIQDLVISSVSEENDVVINVTSNTKLQKVLERAFSREKSSNVVLFADSKGVQKLVSIVGLINDKAKEHFKTGNEEEFTMNQFNLFQNDRLYVYFDFLNNTNKQKSLIASEWVHN